MTKTPASTARPPQVMIRGIDHALWRQLKAEAAIHGLSMGQMLNAILQERYGDGAKNAPAKH